MEFWSTNGANARSVVQVETANFPDLSRKAGIVPTYHLTVLISTTAMHIAMPAGDGLNSAAALEVGTNRAEEVLLTLGRIMGQLRDGIAIGK